MASRTRRRLFAILASAALLVAIVPSASAATAAKWTLFYYEGEAGPLTADALNPHRGTIASFQFTVSPDQALLTSAATGYVKNGNLVGKAITSRIGIDAVAGTTFVGYDQDCATPPTVRFYFDTALELGDYEWGAYVSSLWWSNPVSISLADLLAAGSTGATLSVAIDPAKWSDTDGHFGDADAQHLDYFAQASAHAKTIGFSFGSGCSFAFGDGSNPAGATFNVYKFGTYTP